MKEKLARDEVVASMTVRLSRTIEIARIAQTAGFDTIYVDMEHNTLSIEAVCQICQSAQQIGITPHVRSAADARAMVELVKFPPLGHRSAGGALPQYHYRSFPMVETQAAMNDATSLVLMMETKDALENVEQIIAVEGVDMLLIGSNDLCGELGINGQYDHPLLKAAFERTIAVAHKVGKHVGIGGLAGRDDLMAQFVQMGARYVSTGTDLSFLMSAVSFRCSDGRPKTPMRIGRTIRLKPQSKVGNVRDGVDPEYVRNRTGDRRQFTENGKRDIVERNDGSIGRAGGSNKV